jgi:hypothetical protein
VADEAKESRVLMDKVPAKAEQEHIAADEASNPQQTYRQRLTSLAVEAAAKPCA